MEYTGYPVIRGGVECNNLPLPLYNKPYRYRLHPSCREFWCNLFPKDRGELKSYKPVKYPAGLLCHYKVVVY